jgi:ubiquitin carboxyl-terminal hydrolase 16
MTAGKSPTTADLAKLKKKQRKANVRWWRISDDRVKESSTGQVLGMQKEVYLLFYELDQNFDEQ